MSIESPVGTLDIKNATLRVGKLEVSNIQGIDTALNVTRSNSILLYDDQASATTFNGFTSTSGVRNTASGYLDVAGGHVYWGQKLPNAWTMEFEMDIRSGTNSGPIYANVFSSTNTGGDGYSFTFNDSNDKITLMYDGAVLTETSVPGLFTTSENWQKVVINYERGMITVSLGGSRAFYYNDIEREKPYTTGEYVNVSSSSTDGRKIRGFKVTNGDKWTYSGESNITYTHGSLGIGVVDPTATLDVAGTVNATAFVGDGTLLSNVVNDTDLQSNVTTLRDEMASNTVTLRGDLQSNVTTLRGEMTSNTTTLRGDLQSNVTILRGEMTSNTTTLRGDLQSNVTILRGEMASNTVTLRGDLQSNVTTLRGEMASNTSTLRGDLQSNVTTLRGEMASNTTTLRGDLQSNVTILREDIQSNVTTLRGEMTSNTTTLRGDLQSNVTILRGEMTSNTTTLRGDLQSNVTTLRGEMASNTVTLRGDLQSNVTTLRGEMASNTVTLRGDLQSNVTTLRGEMTSNTTTLRGDLQSNVTTLRGEMASNTVTLRGDLQSNVTTLRDTAITFTGIKTFQDDVILESNLRIQGDILVANTINMTVSDPILELGSNNQNTGDLGLVMTRHGSSNSNVAIFFDESADVLKLGYTLNGANDSTLDLDSNALAVNIQGDLTAASLSGNGSGLTSLNAGNIGSGTLNKDRLPTTLNNTTIGSLAVGTNDVTLTAKADYHGLKIIKAFDSPDEPATLLLAGDGDVFDDIAFEIRGNTTGSTVDTSTTRNSGDTTFAVLHTGTTYIGYNNLNPGEVGGNSQSGDSILNVNGDISATTFSGDGSGLTSLDADNLGSGTVSSDRLSLVASDIPSLDADKITTGTIDSARLSLVASDIPSLDADKITTGTIDSGRLSLTASDIPSLDAAKITTGTIDSGRLSLTASDIPSLDAGKITTGTFDAARISNGTVADSTGGVKAIYFENTEQSGYYTDKSGILAFDENFYDDTEYGTGTYDPDSTFVGGNGGGLLIKNQDGWGAIFTSQNTRWAKGYWNALDITNTVTATTFSGSGSGLTDLNATNLASGTVPSARLSLAASDIPSLDAGKITTGTIDSDRLSLAASDIPSLDAGKITTGTIDSGRLSLVASDIPSLDAGKITTGTIDSGRLSLVASDIPSLDAGKITTGTIDSGRLSLVASDIPSLDAGKITTGTIDSGRLSLTASDIPSLDADKITTGTLGVPINTTTGTFSGDIKATSFVTGRVILAETWPNASLAGDLGTWVSSTWIIQSYTGTSPDGYRVISFKDDGNLTSPTFDVRKYALVDSSDANNAQTKTSTRLFLKCWLYSDSLDEEDTEPFFYIEFSPDNGTTWYEVYRDNSNEDGGTDAGYKMAVADLSPYIDATNSTNAKIRFRGTSPGGADYYRVGRILVYESDVPTNLGGMWLGAGGNIGIGTTNPNYKLDVNGTVNTGALTATSLSGDGSGLTSLNADNLGSGTVPSARLNLTASDIPSLDADKITTGTIDSARLSLVASDIPSLDADKITTGTIDSARLSLTASDIPSLDAGKITTGTIDSDRLSLVASDIPSLDAGKITSGTLGRPINTTTGVFTSTGNAVLVGPSGGGQVGLTINDGDGNTNITFNHASRIPDQNGSSGRIDCGVDGTSGYMRLRVKDNVTGGTSTGSLPDCVRIEEGYVRAYSDFYAGGNVGIGTTSPAYKLDVNGAVNTGALTATTGTFSGVLQAIGNTRFNVDTSDATYLKVGNDYSSADQLSLISLGNIAICSDANDNSTGKNIDFRTNTTTNGGALLMRIKDDGNVGIGTASPSAPLHVQGAQSIFGNNGGASGIVINDIPQARWKISTGGYALTFNKHNSASDEYSTWSEKVRIDQNGNVGIGTTAPDAKLHVNGTTIIGDVGAYGTATTYTDALLTLGGSHNTVYNTGAKVKLLIAGGDNDGDSPYYIMCEDENGVDQFYLLGSDSPSGGTAIMYVNGKVGIGTINPGYKLHVNGTSQFEAEMRWSLGTYVSHAGYSTNKDWYIRSGEAAGKVILQDTGGNVGVGTNSPGYRLTVSGDIYASGNIIAYSDIRKKKNLHIIETPIEKVKKINGYTYEMDEMRYTGLVAQEVLEVLPEAVVGDEEKGYGLAYGNMAGLFVEALKEMNMKFQAEKLRNDALEARIAALENA
jgi:hypothetical protein